MVRKMSDTWDKVMAMKTKDTRHKGVANNLTGDEAEVIAMTVDFFGGSARQTYADLMIPRYRIFDFLGMCVMGDRVGSEEATKVLVHSFLKSGGDVDKFIQDLRETDYDVDHKWEEIEL